MNRKEKRKYQREAPDRAKLQGKSDTSQQTYQIFNESFRMAHKSSNPKKIRGYVPDYMVMDEIPVSSNSYWEWQFPTLSQLTDLEWIQRFCQNPSPLSRVFESNQNIKCSDPDPSIKSCQTCKSAENNFLDFPCNTCVSLYELAFYYSNMYKYKHYKHKDELCFFCAEELKRIKAGDTPCPLDTMEGLLL